MFTIDRPDQETLIFTITGCRVQMTRARKRLAPFACRPVGMVEFSAFATAIDPRISLECLSCPPENLPGVSFCQWRFALKGERESAKTLGNE